MITDVLCYLQACDQHQRWVFQVHTYGHGRMLSYSWGCMVKRILFHIQLLNRLEIKIITFRHRRRQKMLPKPFKNISKGTDELVKSKNTKQLTLVRGQKLNENGQQRELWAFLNICQIRWTWPLVFISREDRWKSPRWEIQLVCPKWEM